MSLLYLAPVAGVCLLGVCIFLLRARRRGSIDSVVRALLEQAMTQRSVMLAEFTDPDLAAERFFGACARVDGQGVLLDVSLHEAPSAWIGGTVRVSFQIDSKNTSSYYQFTGRLRGLPRRPGGFGLLLGVPAEIVPNQKRNAVRIAPRQDLIHGVGVWPLQLTQARPEAPAALGVAQLSYRQDRPGQLSLLNVSAGGLCLQLSLSQDKQPPLDPQPGDRLLCLLMLRSQAGDKAQPFWLDCTVANRREEDGLCCIVGLSFNAWAAAQSKETIEWFTVGEAGAVGPLGTWVLRQQLAQLGQN